MEKHGSVDLQVFKILEYNAHGLQFRDVKCFFLYCILYITCIMHMYIYFDGVVITNKGVSVVVETHYGPKKDLGSILEESINWENKSAMFKGD